jgi:hypothetical protein
MDRKLVRDVLRGSQDVRLRDIAVVAEALGFKVDLELIGFDMGDDGRPTAETKRPRRARVKW